MKKIIGLVLSLTVIAGVCAAVLAMLIIRLPRSSERAEDIPEGGTAEDWAIRRGGAFASSAGNCRSAYRNSASRNGTQYSGARLWLPVPVR